MAKCGCSYHILAGMWMVFFILNIIVVITLISTFEPMLPKSLLSPVLEDRDILESKKDDKLQRSSSFTFD